jgi:hypothetical protein
VKTRVKQRNQTYSLASQYIPDEAKNDDDVVVVNIIARMPEHSIHSLLSGTVVEETGQEGKV